jgi:hypothetical protein
MVNGPFLTNQYFEYFWWSRMKQKKYGIFCQTKQAFVVRSYNYGQ